MVKFIYFLLIFVNFKDQFLPYCSGCHVVHLILTLKEKDYFPINQGCDSGKDKNKEVSSSWVEEITDVEEHNFLSILFSQVGYYAYQILYIMICTDLVQCILVSGDDLDFMPSQAKSLIAFGL